MDEPKVLNYIGYAFMFFGAIPWFLDDYLTKQIQIILLLSFVIISLVLLIISQKIKHKRLLEEFEKTKQKHNALSVQFDEKRNIIRNYEKAVLQTMQVLTLAQSRMKEANLKEVYNSVKIIFKDFE